MWGVMGFSRFRISYLLGLGFMCSGFRGYRFAVHLRGPPAGSISLAVTRTALFGFR